MKKCHPTIVWASLILIAGVFLAAALPKISDPESFAKSIYGYKLLPSFLVNSLALILPQLEALCALALFFPRLRRPALLWIGLMLAAFTLAQLQAIFRGIEGGCGCFGSGEGHEGDKIGWKGVLRNLCLIGLVVGVWVGSLRVDQRQDEG